MQTLFRGGQQIWISPQDAAKVGIKDNDWVELVNRNGVVSCRAIVSHRMPEGTKANKRLYTKGSKLIKLAT